MVANDVLVSRFVPDAVGESDGPLGGAALARALLIGLGAKTIFVNNEGLTGMIAATCRGANLNVLPLNRLREAEFTSAVVGFPVDDREAKEEAKVLMDEFNPKAVIAIERRGPNEKGVYHNWKGLDFSQYEAKVGRLFDEADRRGILTIGIFDGCVCEIGSQIIGDILKELKEDFPYASKCSCPCGAGIVASTKVDIGIPSVVCNWGAYGISACLSALLEKPEVLHDKEMELRMLGECVGAGAVDGATSVPSMTVDSMPARIHAYIVDILRVVVHEGLRGPYIYR